MSFDLDLLHREVDLLIHGTPAGDVSYKGRAGFREWLDQQREVFGDFRWEIEDPYLNPHTRSGPSYSDIIHDRSILFR